MTSEEKLKRIIHGGATPEDRIKMLRELISEEVARQLQREPIPGPTFEGGTGGEWEPKKGDCVEVVDSRGFDPDSEIKNGDVVKCVGKINGRLFLLQGNGQYLAKASVYQIKPVSIQDPNRSPHTEVQERLYEEDLERILREEAEQAQTEVPAEPEHDKPKQWVPKENEWIFFLDKDHEVWHVVKMRYRDTPDRAFLLNNPENIFQTREEARVEADTRNEQNDPEIIPAEPLREMPEEGDHYYFVYHQGKELIVRSRIFMCSDGEKARIQAGLCFDKTPEGKAGAELRAKQGIIPYPITPAKALTEPLEDNQEYWFAHKDGFVTCEVWEGTTTELIWLSQVRIFPYTLAGKLGAALYQEPASK